MQSVFSSLARLSLGLLSVLSLCPSMPAQEPQIEALAEQAATWLSHTNDKTVLVFDFVGPDGLDGPAENVAGDFRASLAKSAPDLQVEGRPELLELTRKINSHSPTFTTD